MRARQDDAQLSFDDLFGDAPAPPVPRRELLDPAEVAARVVRMVADGVVAAVDGTDLAVGAESVCVHGDSPGAVAMAKAVRHALLDAGIAVEAFAHG